MPNQKITVKGTEIIIFHEQNDDYISLTDIARYRNTNEPKDVVKNWMRTRSTIEFLGLWERINNLNFKGVEFDTFKNESGANAFVLSPQKWIEKISQNNPIYLATESRETVLTVSVYSPILRV